MFEVHEKADFNSLQISTLKFHKKHGWELDGFLRVNYAGRKILHEILSVLVNSSSVPDTRQPVTITSDELTKMFKGLKKFSPDTLSALAENPELKNDIIALRHKREQLKLFETMLEEDKTEPEWQKYFEANAWIFGYGLDYKFLHKINPTAKLEQTTTGASYNDAGKRVDALMRVRAEISQAVLIEIKTPATELLKHSQYRKGCWGISEELADAVTQVQKTVFEYTKNKEPREVLKDAQGNDTGDLLYKVHPKSYLIAGSLNTLKENVDKIVCFETFRRSLIAPEILTYDELFQRAKCIVETLEATNK